MFQIDFYHDIYLPLWIGALGIPLLFIGGAVLISTVLVYIYRLIYGSKEYTKLEERMAKRLEEMSKTRRDTYRKISHVLIFIGLFVIWMIAYYHVMHSEKTWVGMIPEDNNMLAMYYRLINEPDAMREVLFNQGWFYFLIFFFFYGLCMFLLVNELTRKTKKISFPFNLFPKLVMTEEEKESYGTYLYFAIGQMFAAFLCPPMVFFAILGMAGIGDLMTSQIGIRYGKHHIKWNDNKTWEGNIAGTITSFAICFFFLGIIWALIFAIAFMAIDLFTDKPINLSDNLLIPIGCALLYVFIRFYYDLNYFTIIMQFFS